MKKTQGNLSKKEMNVLRKAAARSRRSVTSLHNAVRGPKRAVLGPVALWDGKPKRTSVEHDSIYDSL
jgi:hypothetical protein